MMPKVGEESARRRWRHYGATGLLSAGWYALLWYVGPGFSEFPGGVHLIGAALVCGGLLAVACRAASSHGHADRTS